jgi:hypothetical protein
MDDADHPVAAYSEAALRLLHAGAVTLSLERIAVLVAIYAVLGTADRVQVMQKYFSPPQDSIMDSTSRWEAQGTV